jgi:LysM repeat protein
VITLTPFNPGTIVPTHGAVIVNTPAADGSIKYTVQDGDTLFSISLAYNVSVDDLKRLNRLGNNLIYVGNVLIIRTGGKPVTSTVTETITPKPTYTPFVFWTVTSSPAPTATPIPSAPVAGESGKVVVGVIVVAALVLAGVLTASGTRRRES